MNFTRLLAAGRSVMGIKKEPGPYRMNQEHLLPKFVAAHKTARPLKQPLVADVEPASGTETSPGEPKKLEGAK